MKNNYPLVIKYTVASLGTFILMFTPSTDDSMHNPSYGEDDEFYSDSQVDLIE